MAKRSRMTMLKRQRELRKAEKARRKRALKHGRVEDGFAEPRPTWTAESAQAPQNTTGDSTSTEGES